MKGKSRKGGKKMTAGAGGGAGRMQKAKMARMACGGKVKTKRGYGAARKG